MRDVAAEWLAQDDVALEQAETEGELQEITNG